MPTPTHLLIEFVPYEQQDGDNEYEDQKEIKYN